MMKEYGVTVITSTIHAFLYVFLAASVAVLIIPWVFTDNSFSAGLLGMFASSHADLPKAWASPLTRMLGFGGSTLSIFPIFLGVYILLKLCSNYANGIVFSESNAGYYRKLGTVFFFSALFLQPLSHVFFSLASSLNNPPGQRYISISFTMENITSIFLAMVLMLIGRVMQGGQKMAEEQALTV
ncbi:DUF2975 domain-containing protein [Legionella geestiana]|nr:DUF2975 domain-containing protein [Legionella geestiana]QBS12349.1 DUF2975 domain-containing protein [Legionella geestiana]